jgi:hypothetical protein
MPAPDSPRIVERTVLVVAAAVSCAAFLLAADSGRAADPPAGGTFPIDATSFQCIGR